MNVRHGKAVTSKLWGHRALVKGIQAAVTLTQSLKYGDAVFVFDPKNDEWAPSVFHEACKSAGVRFQFVDLSEPIPQLNPLLNSSPDEVAEMLYAGLELSRRGSDSDFYRLDDRKAARFAASLLEKESLSLTEMGIKAKILINRDLLNGAKAFFTAIEEVGEQACIRTRSRSRPFCTTARRRMHLHSRFNAK